LAAIAMRTFFLLFIVFSFSCSPPEYKICEFVTQDKELKLYHDLLTELIEQHFYNGYLRKLMITTELKEKYPDYPIIDNGDTAEFHEDRILLQNRIFNDTSKFETICYKTTIEYGPWTYFYSDKRDSFLKAEMDTTKQWRDIKAMLNSVSQSWRQLRTQ
jgi:hypothetical protein